MRLRLLSGARSLSCGLAPFLLLATVRSPAITPQKKPVILRNGEAVDLRGTVAVERRGWTQFLVLRTADPYALVPNAMVATLPVPHQVVREFGLTLPGQDDRLARLEGKTIRVSGRLQFAPDSPVLWNGTMVWATVAALPGGVYLNPRLPEPGLALAVHRYTATATLRPDRWARTYTARDLETRKPLTRTDLAGCHPTPAGEALHCACSDGFQPYAAVLHTTKGTLQATMTGPFARFPLPDPASAPSSITAEVECARTTPSTPAAAPAAPPGPAAPGTSSAPTPAAPTPSSTENEPHP